MGDLTLLTMLVGVVTLTAASSSAPQQNPVETRSMKKLVFLTREGCVNTVTMRANLNEALQTLALPNDYQFIDADTLKPTDPRGGYGTPTVLHADRDLFGMSEPSVPHPPPTWRLYPGGVPSSAAIQEQLKLALKLS